MKGTTARLIFLIPFIAGAVSLAAPEGPKVAWIEDDEAVIERTLRNGIVEQAGPGAGGMIQIPPRWKAVIEYEFNHQNFIKPVIGKPIEWTNPHPEHSSISLNFQNWVRFRGRAPSVTNRYTIQFGNVTQREDLPGILFHVAHGEKFRCHPFPGFKPGQGRVLLLECRKKLHGQPDSFFWFKIYLRLVPPEDDTI